jgi:hypothetical protein
MLSFLRQLKILHFFYETGNFVIAFTVLYSKTFDISANPHIDFIYDSLQLHLLLIYLYLPTNWYAQFRFPEEEIACSFLIPQHSIYLFHRHPPAKYYFELFYSASNVI